MLCPVTTSLRNIPKAARFVIAAPLAYYAVMLTLNLPKLFEYFMDSKDSFSPKIAGAANLEMFSIPLIIGGFAYCAISLARGKFANSRLFSSLLIFSLVIFVARFYAHSLETYFSFDKFAVSPFVFIFTMGSLAALVYMAEDRKQMVFIYAAVLLMMTALSLVILYNPMWEIRIAAIALLISFFFFPVFTWYLVSAAFFVFLMFISMLSVMCGGTVGSIFRKNH